MYGDAVEVVLELLVDVQRHGLVVPDGDGAVGAAGDGEGTPVRQVHVQYGAVVERSRQVLKHTDSALTNSATR